MQNYLQTQIAKQGIVIVSGLALGIDTIAHTYSKSSVGKTVAVVGSGLNKIYPEEKHRTCKRNYRWWRMPDIRI